jgi:hypothetical protein
MHEIREHMPGTTVVQKLNQGLSRRLGVLSGGGPFWVPFWASKKVQRNHGVNVIFNTTFFAVEYLY